MLFAAALEGNEISWHLTRFHSASKDISWLERHTLAGWHPLRIRNVLLFIEWPARRTGIYQRNYRT